MDFENQPRYDLLEEKWNPVLEHNALPAIGNSYRKKVTAVLLENQEKAMSLNEAVPTNNSGGGNGLTYNDTSTMAGYDPVLMSLVRRAMPNLVAYDIAGVQPMSAPTGLIFAMRSRYNDNSGDEALFDEADPRFSGGTGAFTEVADLSTNPFPGTTLGATAGSGVSGGGDDINTTLTALYGSNFGGLARNESEQIGSDTTHTFREMAFTIERTSVTAKTRALKAAYSTELAQDLRAVHGLDAETELANILTAEILTEINREVMRSIYFNAKLGCQQLDLAVNYSEFAEGTDQVASTGGRYDLNVDSDGRWSAERFRGLMYQIEREANVIAKQTRRGKGNFIICSADVASALAMGGFLNISPALNNSLNVDDTGNTYAGLLNGKIKVYVDPYAEDGTNFVVVGYRGSNPYDAGMFYCPYVPLQMVRAVGEDSFQPRIGFKTRYGMVNNPYVSTAGVGIDRSDPTAAVSKRANQYYRIFLVDNIHGN
jgi:hypothetical protein